MNDSNTDRIVVDAKTYRTDTGFRAWVERNEVELVVAAMALVLTTIALLLGGIDSGQWLAIFTLVLGYIFGKK